MSEGGQKFDAGKPHAEIFFGRAGGIELVPPESVEGIAEILYYGAHEKKGPDGKPYGPRNWEKGLSWMACFRAALRHLKKFRNGQDLDPESGRRHIDHAACNIAFLQAFAQRGTGTDDRTPGQEDDQKIRLGICSGLWPQVSMTPTELEVCGCHLCWSELKCRARELEGKGAL